ncbi:MAG: hypothetical protein ACE5K3_05085 [bacterium]
MKKFMMGILVIGLLVGGAFQQVQAKERKIGFNINLGTTLFGGGLDAFALVSLGAEVDFHLGKHVMISPEVQVWSYKFKKVPVFDSYILTPGVILNFKLSRFFAGGGVLMPFFSSGEGDIEAGPPLLIKFNGGFRTKNIKLTAFVITILFKINILGASIGFGF